MSTLITTGQLTLYDYNDALIAGTPPTNPQVDTLWLDTSTSPNMMKRWNGAKWDNIGELDPEYTEKIETITGNITEIEKTLGNMADDGKLDLTDRQDLVDKLIPIIGYIPSSTDTTLKTAAQLDSLKKGSFAKIRESAVDAGILTTNTAYTGLTTAWTSLRGYLNGLSPKPWDIGEGNKKNDSAVEKATFRTHWLNYYNAEYILATATSKNLNTAITAINNTTIPALQNASLSNSEKAAINQSLLVLTSEKTGMNGEVVALKSNPKFLSQAALDTAKSNYDAAYSSVSSAIAAVMSVPTGTLIPSNLIGAVETAIFQYGEKLSALQREIQNAQTAISNKISADASAELSNSLLEYVDKTSYGLDIAVIQNQVDGAITSYFGTGEPTLSNAPAKDWTTNLLYDTHLGDLYYDNGNGFTYRFTKDGTVYRWIRIQDSDITLALERAQVAQDTADGKRRAFYNQPKPPYDVGDLWVQGEKGELMRAQVGRTSGSFVASDWVKAVKYTDDTTVENLEITDRNYVLNSKKIHDSSGYLINEWFMSEDYELGQEYTVTVKGSVNSGQRIGLWFNGASNPQGSLVQVEENLWQNTFIATIISSSNTLNADTFSLYNVPSATASSATVEWVKLQKGSKSTGWTPAPEDVGKAIRDSLTAAENYANTIKTGLETQIDGKVETYNQTADPATSWTAEEKTKHKGDLWYHPTNKITKLWSGISWTTLEDAVATGAQQLAQAKNRVFTSTPTTPYEIGDLWVQGTSGDLMRCVTARASGSFNINNWGKAVKYTDDTKAKAAATAASNAQTAANNAQADATKANGAVSDIISDSRMTPDEKVILQREWLNIQYERNEILSQAERYVIDNASYRSVYDTLSGYLAPFFTNLTTTQNVNGETLRRNFQRYYEQRQAILDAISVAAQQKVLDLQTQVDAGPFADKTDVLSGTEIFTDKADDSVVHVDIDGNSYQHAGSGKNLISSNKNKIAIEIIDGIEYYKVDGTRNGAVVWFEGIFSNNKQYTIQFLGLVTNHFNQVYVQYTDGASTSKNFLDGKLDYLTTAVNKTVSKIIVDTGSSGAYGYLKVDTFQLEEGSVATPYEPPAPSPDYPIEIHSLNDFDVVSSVGKENLLSNTDDTTQRSNNSVTTPIEEEAFGLHRRFRRTPGANSTLSNYTATFYDAKIGKNYTQSIEVNTEKTVELRLRSGTITICPAGQWTTLYNVVAATSDKERYWGISGSNVLDENGNGIWIQYRNEKVEEGNISTPYAPAPENITESDNHSLIHKTNILLSEPLRSVGDVKDRFFRDSDGLWKIERNVGEAVINGGMTFYKTSLSGEYTTVFRGFPNAKAGHSTSKCSHFLNTGSKTMWDNPTLTGYSDHSSLRNRYFYIPNSLVGVLTTEGSAPRSTKINNWLAENPTTLQYQLETPVIETLSQADQNKLNNIASYKDSNYLYTIVDKTNILPRNVRENLNPNLKATFKSQAWYQNYKRGDDLRHFVEVKGLDRSIRFGMLVDYKSFAMPTANWLYFCKIQTSTDYFREELVDEDGSIFDYTTQREIKVPKQALDLRGVAEGTTGYLAFDTRNQLMWFIHYQRNYTYTTNQETGIIEKIPSSEHWIKWNPGKTGHNTQLVLDESVYIVGEIER